MSVRGRMEESKAFDVHERLGVTEWKVYVDQVLGFEVILCRMYQHMLFLHSPIMFYAYTCQ